MSRAAYVAAFVDPGAAEQAARALAGAADGLTQDRQGAVDELVRIKREQPREGPVWFEAELLHQSVIEELLGLRRAVLELGALTVDSTRLRAGCALLSAAGHEAAIRCNADEQANKLAWLIETSARVAALRRDQLLAGARPANLQALHALHELPDFVLKAIEAGQRPRTDDPA